MENTIYDSEIVSATYLSDEKLIQLRWKKESNSDEYRHMFQKLLDFAHKNKTRLLISDLRMEGLVSLDDVKWLEKEILMKAIDLGVEKIALLHDDTIFSNVYAETIKRKLLNSPIRVQLFGDFTSAKAWLLAE